MLRFIRHLRRAGFATVEIGCDKCGIMFVSKPNVNSAYEGKRLVPCCPKCGGTEMEKPEASDDKKS